MNHHMEITRAIERSRARTEQAERQLRKLRGEALAAPLAELDSLLVYEMGLEARLSQILDRTAVLL
jgi:hypothetical protein